ncbi:MAG: PorV/PorQ family protein [Candidatus Latescibacteria bacterium]|nr:PorV/PorQ family protein [Candidatus Latescibacterota bacterium]
MKKGFLVWCLILTVLVGLLAPPARADLTEYTRMEIDKGWGLWKKRVGQSAFPFLKIGQGARAEALGGAYTAIADDINTAFWNPAGLGHIEKAAYTVNYTSWLTNSKLFSGAVAFDAGFGVIGFSAISFRTEDFAITTPTAPYGTGEMGRAGDIAIAALFAKRITEKLMIGGQVRWMQEDLYLDKMSKIDYSIGTHFYTGFKSTRLAMGFRNLGGNAQATQGGEEVIMPAVFNVAGAMEILGKKGGPAYTTLSAEYSFIVDYAQVARVGVETWLNNMLALRAGYRSNTELENWSVGVGLKHKVKGKTFMIDASYHNNREKVFNQPFRLTFGGSL